MAWWGKTLPGSLVGWWGPTFLYHLERVVGFIVGVGALAFVAILAVIFAAALVLVFAVQCAREWAKELWHAS